MSSQMESFIVYYKCAQNLRGFCLGNVQSDKWSGIISHRAKYVNIKFV